MTPVSNGNEGFMDTKDRLDDGALDVTNETTKESSSEVVDDDGTNMPEVRDQRRQKT